MAYAMTHAELTGGEMKKAGWFGRFVAALAESRERAARREIARHELFVSDTARFMKGVDADRLPFRG